MYISEAEENARQPRYRFYSPYLGQAPVADAVATDEATFLERVLQAHIARSIRRRGHPPPDLTNNQLASVAGTSVQMRADAAAAAGRMIASANQDLAQAKLAGDADAQRTVNISATSGYRGSVHQERLWRQYFHGFYMNSASDRAQLPGGPHADAAVQFMVGYVAPRIAAPGFSNHQAGIAIDLWQERTRGHDIHNSTSTNPVNWRERWHRTWFFNWLQNNAARFNFHPYEVEPWHWEYRR